MSRPAYPFILRALRALGVALVATGALAPGLAAAGDLVVPGSTRRPSPRAPEPGAGPAVLSAATTSGPAAAPPPPPPALPPPFGSVGIVDGQFARLSVANTGAEPAKVELRFLDARGATLAREVLTADPGASVHLDLDGDAVMGKFGKRTQIRALAQGAGRAASQGRSPLPEGCIATMELVDSDSGRTLLLYVPGAPAAAASSPPPAP